MIRLQLIIWFLIISFKSLSQNFDGDTTKNEIFKIVEEMPVFPGGDVAISKFIEDNLTYPESAWKLGIEGRVFVSFVVDKDGSVTDVKIVKGIGGGCDEEVIRVISLLPTFSPGKVKGQPVRVRSARSVIFKL